MEARERNVTRIRTACRTRSRSPFTDIEGSTARWERDPVAMHDAVRRHDTLARTAIAERGGNVFKTGGDAFYSAFASPQDAVSAMLVAQQELNAQDFSAVDGLRVRAAIHTGVAEIREGDYFGPALNKVARLLAIGHGGQVLLTAETAALVDGALPAEVTLRDLGAYHLKDVSQNLNNLADLYCSLGRYGRLSRC